mgnify:FL=1
MQEMKLVWTFLLLLLLGCLNVTPANDVLTAYQARQALANFVIAHPDVFVSPERKESAKDILRAPVNNQASGHAPISRFCVDLDKKTYYLVYDFGKPGSGWFEHWVWVGSFSRTDSGKWKVDQPRFTKDWGE